MSRFRAAALSCLTVLLLAVPTFHPAGAAESNRVTTRRDTASLVSESDSFLPGHELKLGLRLQLAPGWHSYWSNPGDAGDAPTLSVKASGAATGQAGAIDWPAPQRLPDGPLMSYGYVGDVLLPVVLRLDPEPPAGAPASAVAPGPLHLSATADWLVCANVCVPEHAVFKLDLPRAAGAALTASAQAPLFTAVQSRHPLPSPFPATLASGGILRLSGAGLGPQAVADAWFFPAVPGVIEQAAAQKLSVAPGRVTLALRLLKPVSQLGGRPMDGLVVLRDPAGNESFLSIHASIGAAPATAWAALPRLLLFALLGGIVLNLMPCVFPVLAMKALALSRMSGAGRSETRRSAAFYTGGVLVAFGGLGILMLALRAAGSAAGWGFQFQSAIFVAGTCWLLFAVGLNLAGLFEVAPRAAGLGQGMLRRPGHAGDFATGLLAVLVATPCTAPFMGVAIAGALSAPAAVGMAVFLAMGLGLALPYILFATIPGLAGRLPRPGNWMLVLRQALAFPIFASCAWLAWVTSIEGGDRAVLVLASGMVLLALAGWLLGLSQRLMLRRPGGCMIGAAACVLAALALLPGLGPARPATAAVSGTEAFSEHRLAALRAEGRPVFVDMTAAWCVTCLVNERIALSPAAVQTAFAAHHVAYLRGDWTTRNAQITDFLRMHGRDGVPFYVYYPSGGGEGRVLPQILTADQVLREIEPPPA